MFLSAKTVLYLHEVFNLVIEMNVITWPNLIRWFVLGQIGVIIVLTLYILIYYIKVLRLRSQNLTMNYHVVCITTSYILALLFICIEISGRIGEVSVTWRSPLASVVFVLGDIALLNMYYKLKDESSITVR